jgi:hypothetical protein
MTGGRPAPSPDRCRVLPGKIISQEWRLRIRTTRAQRALLTVIFARRHDDRCAAWRACAQGSAHLPTHHGRQLERQSGRALNDGARRHRCLTNNASASPTLANHVSRRCNLIAGSHATHLLEIARRS